MAYRKVNDTSLTSIADTLRSKCGTTAPLVFPQDFNTAIESLTPFTAPSREVMDPDEIYRTTRPAAWLPMPIPGDDEIYLLLHIIDGIDGYFAANLTFNGVCSVEFGTVLNGSFVSQDTLSPISGTRFTKSLPYQNYGNMTSEGYRQCMIRIKGNCTEAYFGKSTINERASFIVDVSCGIPLTKVSFCLDAPSSSSSSSYQFAVISLRYIRFVGNGGATNISNAFFGCENLKSVSCECKNHPESLNGSFRRCRSLIAVSANFIASFSGATTYLFDGCGISALPNFGMTPSTFYYTFYSEGCPITKITNEMFDTSNATNFQNGFAYARSLREILGLNISKATGFLGTFGYCTSLSRLVFAGETTPGGWTISLTQTALGHDALVEMIASLPIAKAAATIDITGNPGASELTDAEIAVATAKNWTITR